MKKTRKLRAALSVLLAVAMTVPMVLNGDNAEAAKKPKLSMSKMNINAGTSKTLKVKNFTKKVTWKTSKASVAKLSAKKKVSVKVTGVKAGTAKITAALKFKGKKIILSCKVTVKPKKVKETDIPVITNAPTAVAAPTASVTLPPAVTDAPTVDPDATASPEPTFDYDGSTEPLWKQESAQIKDLFKDYFMCGISTDVGSLRFGEKAALIRHHFNSVTMGNANKMESIVSVDATDEYPNGMSLANVENYYKTNGEGKIILNYETLEKILSYCKSTGLKLRYHAFIWHSQVAEYFFLQDYNWSDFTLEDYAANGWDTSNYHKLADKETMKKRLNDYISQVIEYIYSHGYGDVVYAYDVINEATNGEGNNRHTYYYNDDSGITDVDQLLNTSSGTYHFSTNGGVKTEGGKLVTSDSSPADVESMLRKEGRTPAQNSYWYATMGSDYLYLSFLYAHNAIEKYSEQYKAQYNYTGTPSLIYNDYNDNDSDHIGLAAYINGACNLVNNTTGVKYCNGIGLQSHSKPVAKQESMIKNIASKGLEVQITELDEGANGDDQASKLKQEYMLYMKYSKNGEYGKAQGSDYIGVTSVTQWGICDGDESSWVANYMFKTHEDETKEYLTLEPKPAFYGVLQAGGVTCGPRQY